MLEAISRELGLACASPQQILAEACATLDLPRAGYGSARAQAARCAQELGISVPGWSDGARLGGAAPPPGLAAACGPVQQAMHAQLEELQCTIGSIAGDYAAGAAQPASDEDDAVAEAEYMDDIQRWLAQFR